MYPIRASFRGKTFKLGKVEIPDPISLKLFTVGKEVRLEVRKGDEPYDPKALVATVDGKPVSLRRSRRAFTSTSTRANLIGRPLGKAVASRRPNSTSFLRPRLGSMEPFKFTSRIRPVRSG